ncbi:hypothetical protein BGX27_009505 [Mortierella sp. AM989]|nr:hypothetical protein BGX27_009505 [Mortierella sp. AM989]
MHKDLDLSYPNLESLTIPTYPVKNTNNPNTSWDIDDLMAMIRAHPLISSLSLILGMDCDSASIWKLISELGNLRNLCIRGLPVLQDGLEYFSRTCARLESLSLAGYHIVNKGDFDSITFPRIQSLQLSTCEKSSHIDDLELIRRCTGLRKLVWCNLSRPHDPTSTAEFHRMATARTWPKLESLTIDNHSLPDDKLAEILRVMRKITTLRFGEGFGQLSYVELRPHFATVKELGLVSCELVTSAMIQEVLSSCPLLEKFEGPRIHAKDITKGRPWVCTELKQLTVCIDIDSAEADQAQPLVFEQMSQLTQLETLNLNASIRIRDDEEDHQYETDPVLGVLLLPFQESIDLRLEKGLEKLCSLELLRELKFKGTTQKLSTIEVDWMAEHWPYLESISGSLNCDRAINEELAERFLQYGVMI